MANIILSHISRMGMGVHDGNFSISKVENAALARMSTVSILAVTYLDMAYVF